MPAPITGSQDNAVSLLGSLGEDVTLDDSTVIQGIYISRREAMFDENGSRQDTVRRLYIPTYDKFDVQNVMVRGVQYLAAQPLDDYDGWTTYQLAVV